MIFKGVLDSDSVKKAISHGEINFRELDGEKPIVQVTNIEIVLLQENL